MGLKQPSSLFFLATHKSLCTSNTHFDFSMISFVIKNGGPQPVQCCSTLAVCSAIFSSDSSQTSTNFPKFDGFFGLIILPITDLVVARLSSASCSWRCQFLSSPLSLQIMSLSQYLGRSMVSPFPHCSKSHLSYVSYYLCF